MTNYLMNKYQLSKDGASRMIRGIIFSALNNIAQMFSLIVVVLFVNQVIDTFILKKENSYSNLEYIALIVGISVIVVLIHRFQYDSVFTKIYTETANTRIKLAETLRKLPLSFFSKRDLSDLTATILGDVATLEHGYSHAVPEFYGAIASISVITVMLAIFNPLCAIALIWPFPIALIFVALLRKRKYRLEKEHHSSKIEVAVKIQEILDNIMAIRSYSAEERIYSELDEIISHEEKAHIKAEKPNAYIIGSLTSLMRLGSITSILVGMSLYLEGDLNLADYIILIVASIVIYLPMDACLAFIMELIYIDVPISRMRELYSSKVLEGEEKDIDSFDIEFKNVSFGYEDEKVLKDVSFTAKQGEVTALVGPSGCGKSTITKLMLRFWDPDSGTVTLGKNDISLIDPESLLKNYSMVFQDVLLFNNTIMENIRIGRQTAMDEEVIEAAKVAQIHDFVKSLPEGYNTVIGENGALLSGGERQRISIARAMLKDAPVILLDESTASIDAESESQFQQALSKLIKDKTVVVIAHRLRTVEKADKIVVLDSGRLMEEGSCEELIAKKGLFYHMWDIQKK